ncbi:MULTISPECIES: hypothetical protein [Reinekea]|jgi:hypothetical protein|uniref:SSU ribosomal protein L13 n=1 Tax=Reinekea forsetii TaxID=1336806 RepID=A0A2K8KUH8_9GAMM|nr:MULTISPECIES: hypothetical protein [Reinekea]ATX78262.1 SSU ribosomal protein L13 [Reinekea forsetii]
MIVYLLILASMTAGASTLVYTGIQIAIRNKRLGVHDARGFYMVALVFITFVLTSVAHYWGDSRFEASAGSVGFSVIGMLFTLCCSLAGLGFGLVKLQEVDPFE